MSVLTILLAGYAAVATALYVIARVLDAPRLKAPPAPELLLPHPDDSGWDFASYGLRHNELGIVVHPDGEVWVSGARAAHASGAYHKIRKALQRKMVDRHNERLLAYYEREIERHGHNSRANTSDSAKELNNRRNQ